MCHNSDIHEYLDKEASKRAIDRLVLVETGEEKSQFDGPF